MFTYKTVMTSMSKELNKGLTEGFNKIDEAFESLEEALDNTFKELGDELKGTKTEQNDGDTCITNNKGHVVIEGTVRSLKVNGVDLEVPVGKA